MSQNCAAAAFSSTSRAPLDNYSTSHFFIDAGLKQRFPGRLHLARIPQAGTSALHL